MSGLKKFRVLIVEDDLALQPFWNLVIRRCFDFSESDWAISGEEAKRMIAAARISGAPYALIISDIFLAGAETGIDLLQANAESQDPTKFLLVSVADAHNVKEVVADLSSENSVLTKPLNLPSCERTITKLVNL